MALSILFSAIVIATVTWLTSSIHIRIKLPGESGGPGLILEPHPPGEKVILMMGVDASGLPGSEANSYKATRSDTMMLVRISPNHKTISVISIPRDSKVYLAEGNGINKINAAHAIGGPELAVQTVQDSLGIPVDNYVVVNYEGINDVVDALGGVSLYIDKPMHYRDRTAKLNINFEPGEYDLNGKEAEAYLRFRHDKLGDIGRVRRQQYFVSSLAQKLQSPWVIPRLPGLVSLARKYVVTDMSLDDMTRLAFFIKNVETSNIRVATLPGHSGMQRGISYWIVDPEPAQKVLDRLLLDNSAEQTESLLQSTEPLKVGLLYTSRHSDTLDSIAANLEGAGFQVNCKQRRHRGRSQIVEHSVRVSDKYTQLVRDAMPQLQQAKLIFAPVGTTYETLVCQPGDDYTLVLGDDITP